MFHEAKRPKTVGLLPNGGPTMLTLPRSAYVRIRTDCISGELG